MFIVDGHCHLSFLEESKLVEWIDQGKSLGIQKWIQGGYNFSDWQVQNQRQQKFPNEIITCLGLHPWAICQMTESDIEIEIASMTHHLNEIQLMGELGLDAINERKNLLGRQEKYLKDQLDLAQAHQKPVVFHFVGKPGLEILNSFSLRGWVHGFTGAHEVANEYIRMGLKVGVGPGVLNDQFKKLQKTVYELSMNDLIIESDAPSGPQDQSGHPKLLFEVAQKVAQIKNMTIENVLQVSSKSLASIVDLNSQKA